QIIKKHYPHLKICASSFARIQTVQAARYWEDLGADKLILPELVSRDFKTLEIIRNAVECELELIANHSCLYYCPQDLHHRNLVSHASQYGHPSGGFAADICKLSCQRMKLADPAELIRSRWIRPEDVGVYEEIGIDCLKLVERFRETKSLMNIWNAYKQRTYNGNLAELLTLPQKSAYMTPNVELLDRSDLMDTGKMETIVSVLREPFTGKIFIDNSKLDGFLAYFKTVDCTHMDCQECGYCERIALKAVVIDSDWQKDMVQRFDKAIGLLTHGGLADYRG
ncbi:MAG: U32 family peptidase, partial [Desulfobacterales bacterium]|nr:U32 family peptidase [Desulfobacterales bacterium]